MRSSTDIDWAAHIEPVARRLCGEPNKHLSHGNELRFGSHGSLSVLRDKGTWYDHEQKLGGGTLDLIRHKRGGTNGDAIDWVRDELKIDIPDRRKPPDSASHGTARAALGRLVATYDYFDEDGVLLYQACRFDPKDFRQRKPKAGSGWDWSVRGVRQVPYRLPELLARPERSVFIAEGEKDVDALRAIDLLATCNAGGAGKWRREFAQYLQGRTVVVLPDNDDAGRAHANDVLRSLLTQPVEADQHPSMDVYCIALPGLPDKGDVSDWLAAGGTREALLALVDAAEPVREMPASDSASSNVVRAEFGGRGGRDDPEALEDAPDLFGHPLNDMGNAARLIAQHGAALRYVVGIGWHVWDGRRYEYDPATVAARRLAHATAKEMLTYSFDLPARNKEQEERKKQLIKFAVGSGNTSKINGMLSQAEPHLDAKTDDLDRDPWLLNCANGTVDLRTGELRPHSQGDLITKLVPVNYNTDAACPIWERVVSEIFGGDSEMISYVQRAIGYSLTGVTTEQVIFIMHGAGSNGKSLLLEIIAHILNDYAAQCASDTFIDEHKGSGIPNDIARLVGSRFASAVETEQGKKIQEALIKRVTGGDRIAARFMRQEYFEFIPKFKLWMATNHKPAVRGTDNAIWRRIRLLPFLTIFSDAEDAANGEPVKDLYLKDKLMNELEGILLWMMEGCFRWQKEGLAKAPRAVMEATADYRESQDATAGFVEECCHVAASAHVKVGTLYSAYKNWCIESGEEPLSATAFGIALEAKNFPARKGTGGVRVRNGLMLKLEYDSEYKPNSEM